MGVRIMYCPGCERRLEIKENTRLDGMKCPICNEALLVTAEEAVINLTGQPDAFFRKVDRGNRTTMNHPGIDDLHFYWNRENFHL